MISQVYRDSLLVCVLLVAKFRTYKAKLANDNNLRNTSLLDLLVNLKGDEGYTATDDIPDPQKITKTYLEKGMMYKEMRHDEI